MVSDAGGKLGYVVRSRQKAYKAILKKVGSKSVAAAIANKGRTKAGRSAMARKGGRRR